MISSFTFVFYLSIHRSHEYETELTELKLCFTASKIVIKIFRHFCKHYKKYKR